MDRLSEIKELLVNYAQGNFKLHRDYDLGEGEEDGVLAGVLMLGEELEESTVSLAFLKNIINTISDAIIITDNQGEIKQFNKASNDLLGIELTTGSHLSAVVPEVLRKIELYKIGHQEPERTEFELALNNGGEDTLPVLVSVAFMNDDIEGQVNQIILLKDLTHVKAAEADKMRAMVHAQDEERSRVSKELHDSLGQQLTAVNLYLNLLKQHTKTEAAKEVLANASKVLSASIEELRNICFGLLPVSIEHDSLPSALQDYFREAGMNQFIHIGVTEETPHTFSASEKLSLFRIAQEFVNNSVKHSGCTRVEITLGSDLNGWTFDIYDNGTGFEIEDQLSMARGNGLKNMISRIKVIDAQYQFSSNEEGTHLLIRQNNYTTANTKEHVEG